MAFFQILNDHLLMKCPISEIDIFIDFVSVYGSTNEIFMFKSIVVFISFLTRLVVLEIQIPSHMSGSIQTEHLAR